MVREALAAALEGGAPAAGAGAGPAAGGVAGVGHAAAAGMAAQGPLATFAGMLTSYVTYNDLLDDEKRTYLQARANFKHQQTETLKDGPGDLTVLGRAIQAVLRVATAITVARYFGPNEELGIALLLSAFDGDALSLARTALADTSPSDSAMFRLHDTLLSTCGRIFRHVQQRCGGMRVTILFSRKASARDGQRLFCFSTYNVSLPSLLWRKRTMSRGLIHPPGAISSRSWRMRRNARPHCAGSYRCFIPRMPATSLRGPL